MSFRDSATLSMVASEEKQHGHRVPTLNAYNLSVLPIGVIYGGNASGKTNLLKALNFAKKLIVKGSDDDGRIPTIPFMTNSTSCNLPTRFHFELLIDDAVYEYSFSVTNSAVIEEKLIIDTGDGGSDDGQVLFNRQDNTIDIFDIGKDTEEYHYLKTLAKLTRSNQLFLTSVCIQNITILRPIYNWFLDKLTLVAPDARFGPFKIFFDEGHPFYKKINEMLSCLDVGVTRIGVEEIPFESIPRQVIKNQLETYLNEGQSTIFMDVLSNMHYIVTRKGYELIAKKLFTYHQRCDGNEEKFDMCLESDGLRRVIELLPSFLDLSHNSSQKIYVIDDADLGLHTLITHSLLDAYLNTCSASSRSQLLLTTHDALLIDNDLLRCDEMWFVERNFDGPSHLMSICQYIDVTDDKDIVKRHLRGKMGGIPKTQFLPNFFCNLDSPF